MQALSSSHLICVPSGASISYCKLFLRSAECTGCYRPRSCPFTILNAAGGLRRRRGREEIVARFGKQYRKESYYVEKLEREEEAAAVWEGAIILKRSTGHIEHCTTLERLGLSSLSSEVSKSTAASMGITVNTDNSSPSGTPLLVSIDVTRKMPRDLLLHGLIRTFISLPCNRCAKQAAQRVFSNFCLLLHEKPLMEPEQMRREELGDLRNDEEVEEEVASNSSAERNWSTYGFIHSTKGNKLASQKVEDLVFVDSKLRLLSHKSEEYMRGPHKLWDILPETADLDAFAATLAQLSLFDGEDDIPLGVESGATKSAASGSDVQKFKENLDDIF